MWRWWVVVGLALLRGAWVAVAGSPVVSNDSSRYWNPIDPLSVFRVDVGLGPGQLVQLVFLALPPMVAIVVQAVVAGLLWGWAALVVAAGRPGLFWAGVVWSLSPWWLAWDARVLTEALMLAGLALFSAGLARLVSGGGSWVPLLAGLAAALLARPLVVVLVAPLMLIGWLCVRRARPLPTLLVGLLVAAAIAQTVVWTSSVAEHDNLPGPQSVTRIQAQDRFAVRMDVPGYLELARQQGLPACADRVVAMDANTAVTELRNADGWCPGLARWLEGGGLPWWRELAFNPLRTARHVLDWHWPLEQPPDLIAGDLRLAPLGGGLLPTTVVMWLLIAVAAVRLLWPGQRWWPRFAMAAVCAGFVLATVMADGLEYWRHTLPAFTVLPWLAAGVRLHETTGSGPKG